MIRAAAKPDPDAISFVRVCRLSELAPGDRRIVDLDGRSVGIFNVDGTLYAVRNRCTHQGGPLCRGHLLSHLHSEGPGDYQMKTSQKLIECPWHGWEYDLETGEGTADRRFKLRRLEVRVRAGEAYVVA